MKRNVNININLKINIDINVSSTPSLQSTSTLRSVSTSTSIAPPVSARQAPGYTEIPDGCSNQRPAEGMYIYTWYILYIYIAGDQAVGKLPSPRLRARRSSPAKSALVVCGTPHAMKHTIRYLSIPPSERRKIKGQTTGMPAKYRLSILLVAPSSRIKRCFSITTRASRAAGVKPSLEHPPSRGRSAAGTGTIVAFADGRGVQLRQPGDPRHCELNVCWVGCPYRVSTPGPTAPKRPVALSDVYVHQVKTTPPTHQRPSFLSS